MKYILLITLFLIGCSDPRKDLVYLVQAPGLFGPNMTYVCKERYDQNFKDCQDTFTNAKTDFIINGIAVSIKVEELK